MRLVRPLGVTVALAYGFLMIALLFVLIGFMPSVELAKWWTTALVVGLIIIMTVGMLFEFGDAWNVDFRDLHRRTQYDYSPYLRYRSSVDWKHKKETEE
jgi:hypothetical protein